MPAERAGPVAGVVMAAGCSRRMGRNKLLLELDGEAVVRRAVRHALEAGLAPVIVVLGHEAEQVRAQLAGFTCDCVLNPHYEQGMKSSVRAGFAALPDGTGAAVMLLADMPFVSARMIAALAQRFRDGTAALVVSRYGEVEAPPMLFARALFPELAAEGCGRSAIRRHRHDAEFVSWPAETLADLDLPEDYRRARAQSTEA